MPPATIAPPRRTPPATQTLSAFVLDGLAPDTAIGALDGRLLAIRLVLLAGAPQRCCSGHQPTFVAIDPADRAMRPGERQRLAGLAGGHAVPGSGLRALAGGIVAFPGLSLAIGAPSDLGPGLEQVVMLTLADAARGLAASVPQDGLRPGTVAIVSGDQPPPPPWRAASGGRGRTMPLVAGLADLMQTAAS